MGQIKKLSLIMTPPPPKKSGVSNANLEFGGTKNFSGLQNAQKIDFLKKKQKTDSTKNSFQRGRVKIHKIKCHMFGNIFWNLISPQSWCDQDKA